MDLSQAGAAFTTAEEGGGFATVYHDQSALPTVGVGHLLTKSELTSGKINIRNILFPWEEGLSPAAIAALFEQDMSAVAAAVTAAVKVPLTQAQFDVLCDFTFNCGVDAFMHSTLLKLLNQGDYAAVPGQLRRWVYSKGQRLPVLAARREREIALWKGESVP